MSQTGEDPKGKLARPKPVDVWIANCEIQYHDGRTEVGALFEESDETIFSGPEPGIKYEIRKSDLKNINRPDAETSPQTPVPEAESP